VNPARNSRSGASGSAAIRPARIVIDARGTEGAAQDDTAACRELDELGVVRRPARVQMRRARRLCGT
jgi:hypothetical protein